MKKCLKCEQSKAVSEYNRDRTRKDGLAPWCRDCKHAYNRETKERRTAFGRNPGQKDRELRTHYGIGLDEYKAMYKKQRGRCIICGKKTKLVVDHNHATGKVRGLLCGACNRAIGAGDELPETFRRIANYLEERGSKHD